MFFILGGVWKPPMLIHPICLYTLYMFVHPKGCTCPPYMSHTPLCICMFLEAFACFGGGKGLPFVFRHFPYTTPVWGCLPFICTSLTLSCWFPVHCRYQYVMWAFSPSVGGLGVFPISWGFWGASALEMSICSFFYIFVVHYVSCFYYGSDYSSSSYSGIF